VSGLRGRSIGAHPATPYNRVMHHLSARGRKLAVASLLGAALLIAQDWKTAVNLPGVDLSGLSPAKTNTALRLLRNYDCTCGCNMKVAECRVEDPNCAYSKSLAEALVGALRQGKSEADAVAAAKASRFGHAPAPPKLLDDPVLIPTLGSPVMGPANARVTLVEFSDFQCPYCYRAVAKINAILKEYPTQVKLIFKQFPLDSHSQAAQAAVAAIAAHQQGKFWAMHDAMFANRQNLSRAALLAIAAKIGLDTKRFTADLDSPEIKKTVIRDQRDGYRAGVEGTPTLFINGQRYNGSLELEAIKPVIDAELKKK
jgi:protein-disulfide isomerase